MDIANLVVAGFSALAAVVSAVIAWCAYSRSKSADDSSKATLDAMRDANRIASEAKDLAAKEDRRQEIKEGARPWVVTFDTGSMFRARNNLNVPMYDVDVHPLSRASFRSNGTPFKMLQDGESFTFFCGTWTRIRITYRFDPDGEQHHFDDELPAKG